MSDRIFNFEDQLKVGDEGESNFKKIYEKFEPKKSDDFRIDFILNNGWTIELKTDSYDMKKTPNFFMEKYTVSKNNKNLGGPWRTLKHDVDYFVYYFVNDRVFFWFEPESLCKELDKIIIERNLKEISIPNEDRWGDYYEALGYKIKRSDVFNILLKEHIHE